MYHLPQVEADLAALCVFADVLGVIGVVLWVVDLGVHPWALEVGVVNLPAGLNLCEKAWATVYLGRFFPRIVQ